MKPAAEAFWEAQFEQDPQAAVALYQERFGATPPAEPTLEPYYWFTLAESADTEALAEAVLRRIAWEEEGEALLHIDGTLLRKVIAPPLAALARAQLAAAGLSREEQQALLSDPLAVVVSALEERKLPWQAAAVCVIQLEWVPRQEQPLPLLLRALLHHKLAQLLLELAGQGPGKRTGFITTERLRSFGEAALALALHPEIAASEHASTARDFVQILYSWLGRQYEEAGQFSRGYEAFRAAAAVAAAADPEEEADALISAADCLRKAGDPQGALALLGDLRERVAALSNADARDFWLAQWLDLRRELGLPGLETSNLPQMPLNPTLTLVSGLMESWATQGRPDEEMISRFETEMLGFHAVSRLESYPKAELRQTIDSLTFAVQRGVRTQALREQAERLLATLEEPAERIQLKLLLARAALHAGDSDEAESRFRALWPEVQHLPTPATRAQVAGHYLELLTQLGAAGLQRAVVSELISEIEAAYLSRMAQQSGPLARSRLRDEMQRELETAVLALITKARCCAAPSEGTAALEQAWRLALLTRNPELQMGAAAALSPESRPKEEDFLRALREAVLHGEGEQRWRAALEQLWEHEAVRTTDPRSLAAPPFAEADADSLLLFEVRDLLVENPLLVLRRRGDVLSAEAIPRFAEQQLPKLQSLLGQLSAARTGRMIALSGGVPRTARASALSLDDLRPLARSLFGDTAPVAPFRSVLCDGELNGIPLEALPLPGAGAGPETLGLTEPLIYRLRGSSGAPQRIPLARGWVGVADIPPFGPHPALPGTVAETEAIEALCKGQGAPTRLLRGAAAHAGNLAQSLAELAPAVLHIAAHGVATRAYPEACALILAPEPGSAAGELLSYRQVLRLPLAGVELVVLSACSSSVGRTRRSAGLEGLAWAFLRAGVGQVVASRWPVGDRATARMMTLFYTHLTAHPAPEALRRARCDARDAGLADAELYAWSVWA